MVAARLGRLAGNSESGHLLSMLYVKLLRISARLLWELESLANRLVVYQAYLRNVSVLQAW